MLARICTKIGIKVQKVYLEIFLRTFYIMMGRYLQYTTVFRIRTWFTWLLGSLYKCQHVLCINAEWNELMGEIVIVRNWITLVKSTCTMAKFSERCHAVNTVRVTFSIYSLHLTVENVLYSLHNCSWNFHRMGHLVGYWVQQAKLKVGPIHVSEQMLHPMFTQLGSLTWFILWCTLHDYMTTLHAISP